jgi:hypothetical protein
MAGRMCSTLNVVGAFASPFALPTANALPVAETLDSARVDDVIADVFVAIGSDEEEADDDSVEEEGGAGAAGSAMLCKRSVEWRGSMKGVDLLDEDDEDDTRSDSDENDDASVDDAEGACEDADAEAACVDEAIGSDECDGDEPRDGAVADDEDGTIDCK